MKILIINGSNLNLLGTREPEIYGNTSMQDVLEQLKTQFSEHELMYYQSNYEGGIIDRIQNEDYDVLVINPGAFYTTLFAIADALKNVKKKNRGTHQ